MTMSRARIVVVDDHKLFRESLVTLLSMEQDLEVVGRAGDGEEAVEVVAKTKPDLVLMDIHMPVATAWRRLSGFAPFIRPPAS